MAVEGTRLARSPPCPCGSHAPCRKPQRHSAHLGYSCGLGRIDMVQQAALSGENSSAGYPVCIAQRTPPFSHALVAL